MNKKVVIIFVIIFLILIIPIPIKYYDGGSIKYKAILYSVTKIHRINHQSTMGYENDVKVEVLGFQVYEHMNISAGTSTGEIFETITLGSKAYHKMSDGIYKMDGFLINID